MLGTVFTYLVYSSNPAPSSSLRNSNTHDGLERSPRCKCLFFQLLHLLLVLFLRLHNLRMLIPDGAGALRVRGVRLLRERVDIVILQLLVQVGM